MLVDLLCFAASSVMTALDANLCHEYGQTLRTTQLV